MHVKGDTGSIDYSSHIPLGISGERRWVVKLRIGLNTVVVKMTTNIMLRSV